MRLLCVVCAFVIACGPSSGPNHPSPWSAPSFFADIPVDTPYVIAAIDPLDDSLRARMYRGVGKKLHKLLDAETKLVKAEDSPWKRAVAAVIDSFRGTNLDKWYDTLGFAPSPRFALYGIGIYPVFRVELVDAGKLRAIANKAIAAAAGGGIATAKLGELTYWTAAADNTMTVMMAVLDRELVIAYVPTAQLPQLLPTLLATEHPQSSLADSTLVPDTLKKHGFTRALFMSVDVGRIGAAVTQMPNSPIGSPDCKADFGRLASYMPRITAGYRRLDADGYAAGFVVETSPGIAEVLGRVRTHIPQLPREGRPLFEMSAGVDVDALIDAVRTAVHELRNQPFKCGDLAKMSEELDSVAQKLDEPLPPEFHGLRGFDAVLDDLTISPPGGRGGIVAVGAHIGELIAMAMGRVPGLPQLTIPDDGVPVSLPVAMLGLDQIKSAHVALRDGVAAFAVGDDSDARVKKALATPADPHAPFLVFSWDLERTLVIDPDMSDPDTRDSMRNMKHIDVSLDIRDGALDFEVDAGWP
jgi:hypothetical protein